MFIVCNNCLYFLAKHTCLGLNLCMDILTKNIDINVDLPLSLSDIDNYLESLNINPLRFSIVKVNKDMVTINVTFKNS